MIMNYKKGAFKMAVPEEIRKIGRPKNTVVVDTGNPGIYRYAVRERKQSVYIPGGNPQPRNGKTIGHIIDGAFIPVAEKTGAKGPDALSYGSSRLIRDLSADIIDDLLAVYPADDAFRILVIASMRIIRPGISARHIGDRYHRTFFSHWYPGLALSENTIGTLLEKIGEDGWKRKAFYLRRMEAVSREHHIVIDGMLKQDTSVVNDLSSYSHKARVKGCRDISILYAYDIEKKEPICAEVFRGSFIDASSYRAFIRDNNIYKGIIVADKGFPPSRISEELEEHPDLHFLTPIKRNDSRIAANGMLDWEGILSGVDGRILYCKKRIKGGRCLYAFKDMAKAHGEENGFLDKLSKDNKAFEKAVFDKAVDVSGTIVFESDLDAAPATIYQCYEKRWLLELVFRSYKNDECLDRTMENGDFSLQGSEFVNFIATLITTRLIDKIEKTELLKKMTYGEVMKDLTEAWRMIDSPDKARSDDMYWKNVSEGIFPELEALGLSIPVQKPAPKKRGRPRTKPLPDPIAPKRKKGRPRKNPIQD